MLEEVLEEFEDGDAPPGEAPEEAPGAPQAFLDAVPEIPEEAEFEEVVELD